MIKGQIFADENHMLCFSLFADHRKMVFTKWTEDEGMYVPILSVYTVNQCLSDI